MFNLNKEQIRCLLGRKRFEWRYSPSVCMTRAIGRYVKYHFLCRCKRPYSAIWALITAQDYLIKALRNTSVDTRFLKKVEDDIRREFSSTGRGRLLVRQKRKVGIQDLKSIQACGIVLKKPKIANGPAIEKGCLLLRHNENFLPFISAVNLPLFFSDYTIVLEPSWSGYADLIILSYTLHQEFPVIVMASEARDFRFLKRLDSNLIPVEFSNGDWVNPFIFKPIDGTDKKYDAVMVSSWQDYKRHHVLFEALHKLGDPSYKVALVSPSAKHRKEIELLIDGYGIRNNITCMEGLSHRELNIVLNQSRVNILLSIQEGGNRSTFEGFFSGVPGMALKNNIGLPKSYFNDRTGKLIEEKNIVKELQYFRRKWSDFDPRPWAMANIAPDVTTQKLNHVLQQLAEKRNEQWTVDLVAKCNSPGAAYFPDKTTGAGLPVTGDVILRYAGNNEIRQMAKTL